MRYWRPSSPNLWKWKVTVILIFRCYMLASVEGCFNEGGNHDAAKSALNRNVFCTVEKKKTGMSEFSFIFFFPSMLMLTENQRELKGKKMHSHSSFCRSGNKTVQSRLPHAYIKYSNNNWESYCPRVKTYNLTFRKIDSTLFFTVTSVGKLICMAVWQ